MQSNMEILNLSCTFQFMDGLSRQKFIKPNPSNPSNENNTESDFTGIRIARGCFF